MYILQAVSSILSAMEQDSLLPVLRIYFSRRESSVQLNGFLLNGSVRGMLEGRNCGAGDTVASIVCGLRLVSVSIQSLQKRLEDMQCTGY